MTGGKLEGFVVAAAAACLNVSKMAKNLSLPVTWASLSLQPYGHPGKHWCSQYSQRWTGHHAPHSHSCGPADRGHQSAGGGGLAAVSARGLVSGNPQYWRSQGWTVDKIAVRH